MSRGVGFEFLNVIYEKFLPQQFIVVHKPNRRQIKGEHCTERFCILVFLLIFFVILMKILASKYDVFSIFLLCFIEVYMLFLNVVCEI
jgi:hypothetical protein